MKIKITILVFILTKSVLMGQLTLVKTLTLPDYIEEYTHTLLYDGLITSNERIVIVMDGKKTYEMDSEFNQTFVWLEAPSVIIYDNQLNELKRVTIDITGIEYLNEIIVSDKIYNTDDKIEIIYSYSKKSINTDTVNVDGNIGNSSISEYGLVILDEDNNLLHNEKTYGSFDWTTKTSKTERFEPTPLVLGDSPYLLKYKKIEDSNSNENYEYFFYKLGGELPCRYTCGSSSTTNKKEDVPSYNVNIYPNPTSSNLNVEIPMNSEVTKCEIYDSKGGFVSSSFVNGGFNTVDVSLLANGTYVCKIYNEEQFVHSDVFIKK